MSVINTMLRDLESREDGAVRPAPATDSAPSKPSPATSRIAIGVGVVAVLGLIGITLVNGLPESDVPTFVANGPVDVPVESASTSTAVPAPVAWQTASEGPVSGSDEDSSALPENGGDKLISLAEWRVQASDPVTLMELDLARVTRYQVESTKTEVLLRMRDTELSAALAPLPLQGTPIVSVHTEADGNDLVMRLEMKEPVHTQVYAVRQSDNGFRILLALQQDEFERGGSARGSEGNPFELEPAAAPDVIPDTIAKTDRTLSASEKIDQALQQVSTSDTDESWEKREQISHDALQAMPEHIGARLSYARALVKKGDASGAEGVLKTGLEYAPHHGELFRSLAELKVANNEFDAAIDLMKANLPAATNDATYLAYLAALYREQGMNSAAVTLYRRALRIRPAHGVWWMGLGISLEGSGAPPDYILKAYLKAEALTRSQPELNSFIAQRVAQLTGH